MFEIRIKDDRINAFRVIKAATKYDAEAKAAAQIAIWNENAHRKLEKAKVDLKRATKDLGDWEASRQALSEEVANSINALEGLLISLISQHIPSWDDFKDRSVFSDAFPKMALLASIPKPPSRDCRQSNLSLLDKLIASRRKVKEAAADAEFEKTMRLWREKSQITERSNQDIQRRFNEQKIAWQQRNDDFVASQKTAMQRLKLAKGHTQKEKPTRSSF